VRDKTDTDTHREGGTEGRRDGRTDGRRDRETEGIPDRLAPPGTASSPSSAGQWNCWHSKHGARWCSRQPLMPDHIGDHSITLWLDFTIRVRPGRRDEADEAIAHCTAE
jgi:hypothetical protein